MNIFIENHEIAGICKITAIEYLTCIPFISKTSDAFFILYMRNDAAIPVDASHTIQIEISTEQPMYASVILPATTENIAIAPVSGVKIPKSPTYTSTIIPYKIFQTWRDSTPHRTISHTINLVKFWNGDAEYTYYDNIAQKHSIDATDVLNAYNNLIPGAYRADLWRYYMLCKHGGVYIDAKLVQIAAFRQYLDEYELVIVKDRNTGCVYNGFICAKAGHPLVASAMAQCIANIAAESYGENPLDITGPQIFGRCYNRMLGRDEKETIQDAPAELKIKILVFTGTKIVDPVTGTTIFKESLLGYREAAGGQANHYSMFYTMGAVYMNQAAALIKPL